MEEAERGVNTDSLAEIYKSKVMEKSLNKDLFSPSSTTKSFFNSAKKSRAVSASRVTSKNRFNKTSSSEVFKFITVDAKPVKSPLARSRTNTKMNKTGSIN